MIELHILNAHGRFTPYQKQLKNAFTLSVQRVTEILPISSVDVVLQFNPEGVIPTFGIGGYVRRAIVERFPYFVFYQVEQQQIVVLAVFHSKRDPKIWQAGV